MGDQSLNGHPTLLNEISIFDYDAQVGYRECPTGKPARSNQLPSCPPIPRQQCCAERFHCNMTLWDLAAITFLFFPNNMQSVGRLPRIR
ncbi:hypothetical protein Plim_1468 [Planctopirus limnophila DSM 3776]|uniref:Uncharacterized protein n=1 Tax=Planctopirus limnophila (strain ATCC 43296 / DSM 3776 / IFAM 1008 / Mu 290) TaxID=521674 RepID=D5SW16_PLAL2|nr:hypothetical protein Plim_1468 [Planctopirus limnophila DSM 3776]